MLAIRLALRHEGNFWNAYITSPDTMANAKLLGSIAIGVVERDPKLAEAFKDLMQNALSNVIVSITGETPTEWTTEPAPESERSGHA